MTDRRLLATLTLVLVGGAVAVLALRSAPASEARKTGGPIAPPRDAGFWNVASAANPHQPLSFGLLAFENDAPRVATLERVELVRASDHIRIVGSYVRPARGPAPGLDFGFSRKESRGARPLAGFRLTPGRTVRVVLGITVDRNGQFDFRGLRLLYRVGDTRYESRWPLGVRLCAPLKRYLGRCKPPG